MTFESSIPKENNNDQPSCFCRRCSKFSYPDQENSKGEKITNDWFVIEDEDEKTIECKENTNEISNPNQYSPKFPTGGSQNSSSSPYHSHYPNLNPSAPEPSPVQSNQGTLFSDPDDENLQINFSVGMFAINYYKKIETNVTQAFLKSLWSDETIVVKRDDCIKQGIVSANIRIIWTNDMDTIRKTHSEKNLELVRDRNSKKKFTLNLALDYKENEWSYHLLDVPKEIFEGQKFNSEKATCVIGICCQKRDQVCPHPNAWGKKEIEMLMYFIIFSPLILFFLYHCTCELFSGGDRGVKYKKLYPKGHSITEISDTLFPSNAIIDLKDQTFDMKNELSELKNQMAKMEKELFDKNAPICLVPYSKVEDNVLFISYEPGVCDTESEDVRYKCFIEEGGKFRLAKSGECKVQYD
jgi:hypothetical protein